MVNWDGLVDLWEEWRSSPDFQHLQTDGIRLVPGVGPDRPKAMVVGEAPGAAENMTGVPFTGPCKVIHDLMRLAGLYVSTDRANAWLTNTIKFRPPGNRTPNVLEVMKATPLIRKEWQLIGRPRLIVAVGSVAAAVFNPGMPIPHRGELWRLGNSGRYFIAYQYHPAYGLRGNSERREMIERQWEHMGEQIREMREELNWHG